MELAITKFPNFKNMQKQPKLDARLAFFLPTTHTHTHTKAFLAVNINDMNGIQTSKSYMSFFKWSFTLLLYLVYLFINEFIDFTIASCSP